MKGGREVQNRNRTASGIGYFPTLPTNDRAGRRNNAKNDRYKKSASLTGAVAAVEVSDASRFSIRGLERGARSD